MSRPVGYAARVAAFDPTIVSGDTCHAIKFLAANGEANDVELGGAVRVSVIAVGAEGAVVISAIVTACVVHSQ